MHVRVFSRRPNICIAISCGMPVKITPLNKLNGWPSHLGQQLNILNKINILNAINVLTLLKHVIPNSENLIVYMNHAT